MRNNGLVRLLSALLVAFVSSLAWSQDVGVTRESLRTPEPEYSPYLNHNYPDRVFWGETHVHTSYSTDAGMIGNRLGPDEAYRFAKGEEVVSSKGVRARIIRPLDFLVVADHSENLGLAPMIAESAPRLLADPWGKQVHDLVKAGRPYEAYAMWGQAQNVGEDPLDDEEMSRSMWGRVVEAAEQHNESGRFTAFIGYEWTSSPGSNNLHRNLVFRDDADRTEQVIPFSAFDSTEPEDLWNWMAAYEERTGGRVLAIPHNGNLSNGLMFAVETLGDRRPLDSDYARRRAMWEPLYEVTQIKGDGETHPRLSPNDEFANFETWDKGNFGLMGKTPEMLPNEYARSALKLGLELVEKLGANPFKFGLVGATDTHTSLATTREENFFGKASPVEPGQTPARYEEKITGIIPSEDGADVAIRHAAASASGLQGIWAKENSREALWDAMKRKETYATTGTRMTVAARTRSGTPSMSRTRHSATPSATPT